MRRTCTPHVAKTTIPGCLLTSAAALRQLFRYLIWAGTTFGVGARSRRSPSRNCELRSYRVRRVARVGSNRNEHIRHLALMAGHVAACKVSPIFAFIPESKPVYPSVFHDLRTLRFSPANTSNLFDIGREQSTLTHCDRSCDIDRRNPQDGDEFGPFGENLQ